MQTPATDSSPNLPVSSVKINRHFQGKIHLSYFRYMSLDEMNQDELKCLFLSPLPLKGVEAAGSAVYNGGSIR